MLQSLHFPLPVVRFLLLISCVFPLFAAGCATHGPSDSPRAGGGHFSIDAPEETVEAPYQPIDDGEPLTPAELAAFQSTGELDAALSAEEKHLVELHFKYFVHKNRRVMERFLKRSEPYLPYVRHVFTSRGLPEELAYLAYVESGFNPNAVSPAGAGGMWQFMPFTGKKYGLSQDRWIDERRDPYRATESAAAYLLKLHEYFGDWLLAVAAYNAGEGKIGKALSGTEASTFFEICRKNHLLDDKAQLRDETQQYVPRFLAVTKIMRNVKKLGFEEPDPKNALSVATLSVPPGVELAALARSANLSWEQFAGLNPAYRRSISPPGASSTAYVPHDREQPAKTWLANKNAGVYAGWSEHRVRKGDSLGTLASRAGVSTAVLRRVNGKSDNRLKVGEYLLVPGSVRAAKATLAKIAPDEARSAAARAGTGISKGVHTIASGDTLYSLALRWDTTVDAICDLNDMEPGSKLRLGQKVRIPGTKHAPAASGPAEKTPEAEPAPGPSRSLAMVSQAAAAPPRAPASVPSRPAYVTVKAGETLYSLSRTHGRSVADLCAANDFTPKTRLRVGQKIRLAPVPRAAELQRPESGRDLASRSPAREGAAPAKGRFAVVQSGDTLDSLARHNKVSVNSLARLNGLNPRTPLKTGQLIRLP